MVGTFRFDQVFLIKALKFPSNLAWRRECFSAKNIVGANSCSLSHIQERAMKSNVSEIPETKFSKHLNYLFFCLHCIVNLTIKQRVIKRHYLLGNWHCKYLKAWLKGQIRKPLGNCFKQERAQAYLIKCENLNTIKTDQKDNPENWELSSALLLYISFPNPFPPWSPVSTYNCTLIISKEWLTPTK